MISRRLQSAWYSRRLWRGALLPRGPSTSTKGHSCIQHCPVFLQCLVYGCRPSLRCNCDARVAPNALCESAASHESRLRTDHCVARYSSHARRSFHVTCTPCRAYAGPAPLAHSYTHTVHTPCSCTCRVLLAVVHTHEHVGLYTI